MNNKNIITLILVLFYINFSVSTFGQSSDEINIIVKTKIDSLNSEKDIETFIRSLNERYKAFEVINYSDLKKSFTGDSLNYKAIADSLHIYNNYYKADIDGNNYTDLLVISNYNIFSVFIIMNFGNNNFQTIILSRMDLYSVLFTRIILKDNLPLIECHWIEENMWPIKAFDITKLETKFLTYKFNSVVEYNTTPSNHQIENIYFYASKCFGPCPSFELEINSDREGFLNAISDNRKSRGKSEIRGEYKTKITKKHYNELIEVLNYLSFETLSSSYSVNWTDDQSCELEIVYNNGKIKRISDYGLIGTYGLRKLYKMLFELRFNQNWE